MRGVTGEPLGSRPFRLAILLNRDFCRFPAMNEKSACDVLAQLHHGCPHHHHYITDSQPVPPVNVPSIAVSAAQLCCASLRAPASRLLSNNPNQIAANKTMMMMSKTSGSSKIAGIRFVVAFIAFLSPPMPSTSSLPLSGSVNSMKHQVARAVSQADNAVDTLVKVKYHPIDVSLS